MCLRAKRQACARQFKVSGLLLATLRFYHKDYYILATTATIRGRSKGGVTASASIEFKILPGVLILGAVLRESGLSQEKILREVCGAVCDEEVRDAPSEPCWRKQSGV